MCRCGGHAKPVSQNGRRKTDERGMRKDESARTVSADNIKLRAEKVAERSQKDNTQRKTNAAKEPEQPKV